MGPIEDMAGPLLIGYLLNLCLLGILFVQVYIYTCAFVINRSRETTQIKILVYAILLLETIQSSFILRDAFVTFAQGFDNVSRLEQVQFTWLTMPVMSSLVACIVQFYYAYRLRILTFVKRPYAFRLSLLSYALPAFICLLSVTQCASGFAVGIDELQAKTLTHLTYVGHIANILWPIFGTVCDVTIAITTAFYIRNATSMSPEDPLSTHFKSDVTQTLFARIFYLYIQTGALTATFSSLYLILWLSHPDEYYFMTFAFIVGKIYANSLLAILNSRSKITDLRQLRFFGDSEILNFSRNNGISSRTVPPQAIHLSIEVCSDRDSLEKNPL